MLPFVGIPINLHYTNDITNIIKILFSLENNRKSHKIVKRTITIVIEIIANQHYTLIIFGASLELDFLLIIEFWSF